MNAELARIPFRQTCLFRVSLSFAAIVSLMTGLALLLVGVLLFRGLNHNLDLLHDGEFEELSNLIGKQDIEVEPQILQRLRQDAENDKAIFFLQLVDADGQLIFRSKNLLNVELPAAPQGQRHGSVEVPELGSLRLSQYALGKYRLQVASLLSQTKTLRREYLRRSLSILFLTMVLSVAVGWAFARITLRPLREIHRAASQIKPDSLGVRIPEPDTKDEIAALARLLNQTFDSLDRAFSQVKRFSADASHELKTPLALIRLNAERVRLRCDRDEDLADAIDQILEECEQMQRSIEILLFLAKVDAGVLKPPMRDCSLAPFLESFREDAEAMAEEAGCSFFLHPIPEGNLHCEPTLIRQVLLNLLSNSLRHAPKWSLVELKVKELDDSYIFSLSDEGPGVPPEQLETIFERFVQFKAKATDGFPRTHGLGLSIVRSLVELHSGKVQASNRSDRESGLCVTVTLPMQRAKSEVTG